jgi:hypothetical protein
MLLLLLVILQAIEEVVLNGEQVVVVVVGEVTLQESKEVPRIFLEKVVEEVEEVVEILALHLQGVHHHHHQLLSLKSCL